MRKLVLLAGSVLAGISLIGPLQGAASAQTGKLVVIVLENEPYASIVGNSQAPYLNQLIAQGNFSPTTRAWPMAATPTTLP